jgi:single-strand DNA-binding protein
MNIAIISGNLGADPELRSGVLKLRVATSERMKKGEEWVDHTEWHSATLFGKRAEALMGILAKGDKVTIQGKIRTSSYEKNGEKRYSTEIIVDDIEIATKGGASTGGGARRDDDRPRGRDRDDLPRNVHRDDRRPGARRDDREDPSFDPAEDFRR